jgi:molecular chaperone DnaK (HSP70)
MAEERVIGIDLGTTNSLVAFMQGEQPVVIPGEDGSALVPSVVAIPPADSARPATSAASSATAQRSISPALPSASSIRQSA